MEPIRSFLFFIIFSATLSSNAQNLSKTAFEQMKKSEDSMKNYSRDIISEKTASQRFTSDSIFIRMLVRSLKTNNSFYYPFDSLDNVSRIYAPDSSFRIFSWQWSRDDDYVRQRGAIQMKTSDGSLQLFPLLDMSDFTTSPEDSIRNPRNWIGAIYYGIVMKTYNNKKYYTLLGYDDNNRRSAKKWIEVLSFDERGKPVFGGPFFALRPGKVNFADSISRYCMEYKKDGRARMNYDKDMDMIVYDHLVSENNEPDKPYTMIPDGDYQGFKWIDGKWVLVDKVFTYKLQDGQAPVPAPLKDATGKSDEMKLMQQSEKNRQKQEPVKKQPNIPVKKTTVKKQAKDDDSN